MARPPAPRAVDESCDVRAATPAKATPTAAMEAPATSDPSTGSPLTIIESASAPARTTSAATATVTAAATGAACPMTPARKSSARPVSSFWRVCRTTQSTLMTAARTMMVMPLRTML